MPSLSLLLSLSLCLLSGFYNVDTQHFIVPLWSLVSVYLLFLHSLTIHTVKPKHIFLQLGVLFRFLGLRTREVRLWVFSFVGLRRLLTLIIFWGWSRFMILLMYYVLISVQFLQTSTIKSSIFFYQKERSLQSSLLAT